MAPCTRADGCRLSPDPGIICIHLPECREPLSLRVSLRLASCGDRGVPAGTCFENEVRQIDACFRPASLMATAPTNSSDSWEVRHVPGVDDASVPCPLISRCEEHSAHICCRHAFLPPSFLLSPVRVSCPERTFLKVRASEHGHGFSQPCAAFTPTRAHVMACLIHDSRLTSAIDLGHTLPPCLKPMLKPY